MCDPFILYYDADIDECTAETDTCHKEASCMCHQKAMCNDTQGSYTCTCNSGYTGDGQICNGKQVPVHIAICLHQSLAFNEMNRCNLVAWVMCTLLLSKH